jgi:hypothetical protein
MEFFKRISAKVYVPGTQTSISSLTSIPSKNDQHQNTRMSHQVSFSSDLFRKWKNRSLFDRIEYFVAISIFAAFWSLIVYSVLSWHKFPFHRHKIEVFCFVVVPLVALAAILAYIEYLFSIEAMEKSD